MENDKLSQTWNSQSNDLPPDDPNDILRKAKQQRNGQLITITVLSVTVLVLIIYAFKFAMSSWNDFALGLILMISSLVFRIILEFITIYRKESQLIALDNRAYQKYLKHYYGMRLKINYIITPICFIIYIFGFIKLLPYFKNEFSEGFYTYIIVSGIVSLIVLTGLVIYSTRKEHNFLKGLKSK